MIDFNKLTNDYYEKFVGLPNSKPIVRENITHDAFEIVVLETLYGKEKNIDISKMSKTDISTLTKYIVAPPDNGIDIVIEHNDDLGESSFDFVQVKDAVLAPIDIQKEINYMETTINQYIKTPNILNENLKSVLAETSLSKENKENCKYILVHKGTDNFFKGQVEKKHQVITLTELETLRENSRTKVPKVGCEKFGSDSFNNFISYDGYKDAPAILMNICGYDLATLALKYTNTTLGRNILFGQNLRESLEKSKTYEGMKETIKKEPEKFWFYNNGITIIAEDFNIQKSDSEKVDSIILKNFSIINGAQTTSALGKFLRECKLNMALDDIEKLKSVFVLARVLKVTDDDFKSQIAIFNNTQNPITTRDMASNREEQRELNYSLITGDSHNIYMEIRRGTGAPDDVQLYKHQRTTNVELAQLAFAGFKRDPFVAKDKKNAIFDTDYKQETYLLNEYYHAIFSPEDGVLYKKSKKEIDELLFIYYLYNESKKSLNRKYKERISQIRDKIVPSITSEESEKLENDILEYERLKAINNTCVFYCLAYYYCYKNSFSKFDDKLDFDYKSFYFATDREYQNELINAFRDFFLTNTIEIIKELAASSPNLNTWVRDRKSSKDFVQRTEGELKTRMQLESLYKDFVKKFKKPEVES